jgi:hypothetical protein
VFAGGIDPKRAAFRIAFTDVDGVYELPHLPNGRYMVLAEPPPSVLTHLPQLHGQDGPYDSTGGVLFSPGAVLNGRNLRSIDISLTRAFTIEGRVVDEAGSPLAGIPVTLNRTDRAVSATTTRFTDDRGTFRHFGLVPGRYRVCAAVAPAGSAMRGPTMRRACATRPGQDIDLKTSSIDGVELRLRRFKAASVSGAVRDASGAPLDAGRLELVELGSGRTTPVPLERVGGGRFVSRDLEPGRYRLAAVWPPESPLDPREREQGSITIDVEETDIDNVQLQTRRPVHVSGVLTFEGGAPERITRPIFVIARPDGPPIADPTAHTQPGGVREDFTFQLGGLFGASRVSVLNLPGGWVVKSVFYRGVEITGVPTEFETSTDPRTLEIVVTNRVGHVTGKVAGADGRQLMVLLISPHSNRWMSTGAIVAIAPTMSGSFEIGPVPAGDYLLALVSPETWASDVMHDAAVSIERAAARGVKVFLAEGERRSLTLFFTGDR